MDGKSAYLRECDLTGSEISRVKDHPSNSKAARRRGVITIQRRVPDVGSANIGNLMSATAVSQRVAVLIAGRAGDNGCGGFPGACESRNDEAQPRRGRASSFNAVGWFSVFLC